MDDIRLCAARHWRKAFQIAIRQSTKTERVRGPRGTAQKKRTVALTEEESMDMFRFYLKYVKNDRAEAVQAIGVCAKLSTKSAPVLSCGIFVFFLAFVLQTIFHNIMYPVLAVLIAVLVWYLLDARERRAVSVWRNRKNVKDDETGTLERICLVLDQSPFRCASLPVVTGFTAAILVAAYYSIGASLFG